MTRTRKIRFLADESCDFSVVRVLRTAGYDVKSISEESPGTDDSHVIESAIRDKRILLTEDSDFGQLVFSHGRKAAGVIFMRYPARTRSQQARDMVVLVDSQSSRLQDRFIVAQPGRIRIIRIPD